MRRWILRLALLSVAAVLVPACGLDGTGVATTGTGIAVAGLQLLARGGTGTTGNGGNGGDVTVTGNTGSDLRLIATGQVNSSVPPRVVAPNLGANPRTILVNTTYTIGAAGLTTIAAGETTLRDDTNTTTATGLYVAPGVTLTLPANDNGGASTFLRLSFASGVHIEGTIRMQFVDSAATGDGLGDDCADLTLDVGGNLVIASTGTINLDGRDDAAGTDADNVGGSGGDLTNIVNSGFGFVGSNTDTLINAGQILSRGGVGEEGGNGGSVSLIAEDYDLYNSGTINTGGGAGTVASFTAQAALDSVAVVGGANADYTLEAAPPAWITVGSLVTVSGCNFAANNLVSVAVVALPGGNVVRLPNGGEVAETNSPGTITLGGSRGSAGDGGTIFLSSEGEFFTSNLPGGAFNTGSLLATGGAGTISGGDGGNITLDGAGQTASADGALTSTGTLNTSGGNAVVAAGNGGGGNGGDISLIAGGTMRVTGTLASRGGDGVGQGTGGDGGSVDMTTLSSALALGASLNASGGDGSSGGNGGDVDVSTGSDTPTVPNQAPLTIIGYTEINASGGDGAGNGGNAGNLDISNNSFNYNGDTFFGSIRNEVALNARGGNGTAGGGGNGGLLDMTTSSGGPNNSRSVTNVALINLSGGTGPAMGGNGGAAFLYDTWLVSNDAAINVDGGASTPGVAGWAGGIQLVSDDVVTNNAALSAAGGQSSTGIGGWGGVVLLQSRTTSSDGDLTADAGNGGTQGGTGGLIELYSTETITVINGTLSVQGGAVTGPVPVLPRHGRVRIDGIFLELIGGQVSF